MKEIPWQDQRVVYQVRSGEWKGFRIEEIKAPWDLYLEGRMLETNISDLFHLEHVEANRERIFSIRDNKREPIADIVCMPVGTKRYDSYWPVVRILKTSNPMKINNEELIVLDVIARKGKNPNKQLLAFIKEFFKAKGGVLDNAWPLGAAISNEKKYRKWEKVCEKGVLTCLAICSKSVFMKECKTQAFSADVAINKLKDGFFDDIYMCSDDPWMEQVFHFLKDNPDHRPIRKMWVFGTDKDKKRQLLDGIGAFLKESA